MTATDELRRMLNERNVEWTASDGEHVKETCWTYMGELTAEFAEYDNGTTRFACDTWCFTPEQAVAATLGSSNCTNDCTNSERTETCEMEYVTDWMSWHCKSCDHMDMAPRNPKPRYCKWCGRKVVDDD